MNLQSSISLNSDSMEMILLGIFAFECLAIVVWGLLRRRCMIQFPFLAATVFFGWMLPQLIGLTSNNQLPLGGLQKTTLMAIFCLAATFWGYRLNRRPARLFEWNFNRDRLILASAIMSVLGAYCLYKVNLIAPSAAGSQWSGTITIYSFFGTLLTIGMAIALLLHLQEPRWTTLSILLLTLVFYLDRVIIRGRRAAMVELGLMLLMALWFRKRWLPPRWAMALTLGIGILIINSIGDYRDTMLRDDRWTSSGAGIGEIMDIDYLGNLQRLIDGDSTSYELTNAIMNIEAVDRQMKFDFGLSNWDELVRRFMPAQIIGEEKKQALMFDFGNLGGVSTITVEEFGYYPSIGSTSTGLSDSFQSFWYFGAINFYIIGLIMSRWYLAAVRGSIAAQMVSLLTVTAALHAITHSTHWFLVQFVQLAAFLLPILLFARIKHQIQPGPVTSNVSWRPHRSVRNDRN